MVQQSRLESSRAPVTLTLYCCAVAIALQLAPTSASGSGTTAPTTTTTAPTTSTPTTAAPTASPTPQYIASTDAPTKAPTQFPTKYPTSQYAGYTQNQRGHCDTPPMHILSKADCEKAALQLNLPDKTAYDVPSTGQSDTYPKGCYIKVSSGKLNWNIRGTYSYSGHDRLAICRAEDPNKCSVVIYPDANYNGVPIAHYSTDSTGGQTFSLPNAVENDISSFKAHGNCKSVTLWDEDSCSASSSDNKEYMHSAAALSSDLNNDVCAITVKTHSAAVLMTYGYCDTTSEFITSQAECESAAKALGLSDTTANVGTWATNPHGCYLNTGSGSINYNLNGDKKDDTSSRKSICRAPDPLQCSVKVYENDDYVGKPLVVFTTKSRSGITFSLTDAQEDAVESVKLSGFCDYMILWDEDNCAVNHADNKKFHGSVSDLYATSSDLDKDVCKITVRAKAYATGSPTPAPPPGSTNGVHSVSVSALASALALAAYVHAVVV